jgi:hypothetical protein
MTYYLYVKTHNKTGLKYLGQTSSSNPYTYRGSGTRWLNHLKKHGNDVSTKILIESEDKSIIKENGIEYSKYYNVVESQDWANLKLEEGDGGFSHINENALANENRLNALKKAAKEGRVGGLTSGSFKKGDPRLKDISKKANEAKAKKIQENPNIYKESYKKISKHQKENNSMKNKCWCVPKNLIDKAKFDSNKRVFDVDNIPVEWIQITEARDKLKTKTGTYGTYWIHNPITKENKLIKGEIPEGWYKGRKLEYCQNK